jgi:calcium-dependent protein kinase
VVEDTTRLNIVTELCKGGELFDRIIKSKTLSENLAANYMSQIFSALIHIHDNQIVHRDLKPENIVFESESDDLLKLIDFGIAQKEDENKSSKTFNGTVKGI